MYNENYSHNEQSPEIKTPQEPLNDSVNERVEAPAPNSEEQPKLQSTPPTGAYTSNPYNMSYENPPVQKPPQGPYGYSYDYSNKNTPPKKKSNGILVFLGIMGAFCVVSLFIIGLLAAAGYSPEITPSATPTPTVTGTAVPPPSTAIGTEAPATGSTAAPKTDDVHIYVDNDGWINNGTIVSDDAYINATYRTIDSVVAITTETASYNAFYGNYVSTGAGSGVVFGVEKDENGKSVATYIITNNHVVAGATKIKVTLTNGNTHQATLIGTDAQTDIAVIKISAVGLKYATLGNSSEILLSQPVIAIGNPLGELANTVTDGRISGLERSVTIDGVEMSLIQTNAAVNPGNSGGGLFNLDGELIGIVNAKSSGDSIEGIGFAIPINTAKAVAEDIIKYGYVSGRPSIGIFGSIVTKDNYQYYKDSDIYEFIYDYYYANNGTILEGFYIENDDLVKYASDDGEKFTKGDVVAEVNGIKVQSTTDIANVLSDYDIGQTATISVYRLVKTTGAFGREKTEIRSFDISIVIVEKTS